MKIIFNWLVPAVLVAGLTATAPAGAVEPSATVERAELVMGTVARVAIFEPVGTAGDAEPALAAFRAVDAAMSLYRPSSELVGLNAAAPGPERVSPDLFALLVRAQALSRVTEGAFDVTILPLLRAFGAYPGLDHLTDGDAAAVGFEGLVLDASGRTARFRRPGMGIDLGAVAKGFALDRARRGLAATGIRRARLDLGGCLAFVGRPAGGWRVGVRDPAAPETTLGVLVLEGGGIATSSNYGRDFAAEGWRAPTHVYDPRTGRPVLAPRSVTVWAADATTADALSTALMVLGPEAAPRVLARVPPAGALFVEDGHVRLRGAPPMAWAAASSSTKEKT